MEVAGVTVEVISKEELSTITGVATAAGHQTVVGAMDTSELITQVAMLGDRIVVEGCLTEQPNTQQHGFLLHLKYSSLKAKFQLIIVVLKLAFSNS